MAKNGRPRFKKWWKYVIGWLIWLVIAFLIWFGFLYLDSIMPTGAGGDQSGHWMPVFSMLSAFVLAFISLILLIRLIVKIVRSVNYYRDHPEL